MKHRINNSKIELEKELARLISELEERKASLPAHSMTPAQMIKIEELENEIELLNKKLKSM